MKSPDSSQPEKNPEQPAPLNPEQKLALAQQDAEKFQALAGSPNLSPNAAAWALDMARSAKAEVALRQKAAAYQAEQQNPVTQGDDAALKVLLGLPLNNSPQSQPSSSNQPKATPSTSPGTSGSRTSPT